MSLRQAPFDVEIDALLDRGRAIPRAPESARARVLERARETAALPVRVVEPVSTIRARLPFGSMALVAAVGIAAAATYAGVRWRARLSTPTAAPSSAVVLEAPVRGPELSLSNHAQPTHEESVGEESVRGSGAKSSSSQEGRRGARTAPRESYDAELDLLRQAHNAYAARDFSGALVLVAEHSRRFPSGVLSEEREALRVRSLASAGRTDDARRAAKAFASRFPRSVLLGRIRETIGE